MGRFLEKSRKSTGFLVRKKGFREKKKGVVSENGGEGNGKWTNERAVFGVLLFYWLLREPIRCVWVTWQGGIGWLGWGV